MKFPDLQNFAIWYEILQNFWKPSMEPPIEIERICFHTLNSLTCWSNCSEISFFCGRFILFLFYFSQYFKITYFSSSSKSNKINPLKNISKLTISRTTKFGKSMQNFENFASLVGTCRLRLRGFVSPLRTVWRVERVVQGKISSLVLN